MSISEKDYRKVEVGGFGLFDLFHEEFWNGLVDLLDLFIHASASINNHVVVDLSIMDGNRLFNKVHHTFLSYQARFEGGSSRINCKTTEKKIVIEKSL